VLLITYGWFSDYRAESKAREYCSEIKVGRDTTDIPQSAIAFGAEERRARWFSPKDEPSFFTAEFRGFLMSRHICWIKAENGKVVDAHYVFFD